jgi:hypothetical protein
LILLALMAGLLTMTPVRPASANASDKGIAPEALLNADGTLRLDENFRGALDIGDWNVSLDPALGPVFSPIAAMDAWSAISAGGGAFKSAINAIVVNGTDVYVGGAFTSAGGTPEADYIAKWDGTQWTSLSNGGVGSSALAGTVNAMLFFGGNLYVAGQFAVRNTSGVTIANSTNFAKWDGSVWSAVPGVASNLNGIVYALDVDANNNIIYIGGGFVNMNGNNAADKIAGIDLDTSALVTLGNNGPSLDGSLSGTVYAIAVDSTGKVYAGGAFLNVNDGGTTIAEADRIARWDGANWSALGSNGSSDGALNSIVTAVAVDGSDNVYAGGWFFDAAGIAEADCIAKWNGLTWSALGNNGSGDGALVGTSGGSIIQDIVVNGTDVYASGFFLGSSSIPTADYAARFDTNTNTWFGLGSDGSGDGSLHAGVYTMAYSSGKLYVGGALYDVSNGGTKIPTADHFAIWNGANWSTLGDSNGALNNTVEAIAVIGSDVYVGGNFVDLGGDQRMDYLVRWDGTAWNPVGNLTQTYGALSGKVNTLAVDGTNLYAGGDFTFAYNEGSSVAVNRIAKWDGSTWSALGGGVNSSVYALAVDANHNLYAGGSFTNAAFPEADYIAMWNGSAWSALAGNGASNGALNSSVFALAIHGTNVYVGGSFTTVLNTSNISIPNAERLAKWDGSTWSAMDGITSPTSNDVYKLAVSGSDLYVGGFFNDLNGISAADRVARWDGSTWSALGSNGANDGVLNGYVNDIVVNGTRVYIGGIFTNVQNGIGIAQNSVDYIAMWDGTNWSGLGSDGSNNGSLNNSVQALKIIDNDLWVGGNFQNVTQNGNTIKEADFLAAYGVDVTAPAVQSITRAGTNPTSAATVDFTVTFSEPVTGVTADDFTPTQVGVSGATVGGISGSGAIYTLTVNTGSGNGTIRLDLNASGTGIVDLVGHPITSGFTGGAVYNVTKSQTAIFRSSGTEDGWALESSELSNIGGTLNSTATTFSIGDNAQDKQYRSILHFNLNLPSNAVITKVTLKIRKQGLSGANPFATLGKIMVDIRTGAFSNNTALQITDFQAGAHKNNAGIITNTPVNNWYSVVFPSSAFSVINKTGVTQFRLRFQKDDNDNGIADTLKFYSGNYATTAARPTLIIEYYVP